MQRHRQTDLTSDVTDYETLYADADEMRSHWWWRPGWHAGTRFYAWHLTLDDQDDLHRLVDDVQDQLRDISTLDPVPRRWRHVTMTGMGHVGDVPDNLRDLAVENVRHAIAGFGPIAAIFKDVSIFTEAVVLRPCNPEVFAHLQHLVQNATAAVVAGADAPNARFRAHVTTHYCNAPGPTRSVALRRGTMDSSPASASFNKIDLIRMHRDCRMYEWEVVTSIPLE